MIFITVGSQKFQFNRLLMEIDVLIEKKKITDQVFAQIGYSTYKPKYYSYKEFLDKEEFIDNIEKSELIITHGGTGSIINGIKKEKKVIGVPRLQKFEEHVDNHQLEIINQFTDTNMIYPVYNIKDLESAIEKVKYKKFAKYQSNTNNIIKILNEYLMNI